MKLKFLLYLARSGGELYLERTEFWPPDADWFRPAPAIMNRQGAAGADGHPFRWESGQRALAVLFLRAFAGSDPTSCRLEGRAGSLARSLADVLGDRSAKKGADGASLPTWVQKMFDGAPRPKGDPRVPKSLFGRYENAERGTFWVCLGTGWVQPSGGRPEVEFQVLLEGQPQDPAGFVALADELEGGKVPHVPFSASLEFLAYDGKGAYHSILTPGRLPLAGGTPFEILVHLTRPGWYLLVWVDGHGTSAPMGEHPDGPAAWQDWESFRFFKAEGERRLPAADTPTSHGRWRLDQEAAAETVLLLASRREPDVVARQSIRAAFERLADLIPAPPARTKSVGRKSGAAPPVLPLRLNRPTEAVVRQFSRAQRPDSSEKALPTLDAAPIDEPIHAWHEYLGAQLAACLDRTVILSFANHGTTGACP